MKSSVLGTTTFLLICQIFLATCQRLDRFSCERRPTHTRAGKTAGDNGFSIKILGSPAPVFYESGKDYEGNNVSILY